MHLKDLKLLSNKIRKEIVTMVYEAGSGHPGGALGLADIFTVLYNEVLRHRSNDPNWKDRDFVILSNGHVCPVLYATLAYQGYFPKKELKTLRKLGTRLQGHPHNGCLPGVENSGGPLGQGISQAVGLAASLKRDKKKNRVYCFVGDGELEEGQVWEALLFASKEKLDNFVLIVDRNDMQIDDRTRNVMPLEPLSRKFTAFNFGVINFDGNDIKQVRTAFKEAAKIKDKSMCLIAKTIPGKGVSYMENDFHWHGKIPNKKEFEQAMVDLYIIESKIKKGEL